MWKANGHSPAALLAAWLILAASVAAQDPARHKVSVTDAKERAELVTHGAKLIADYGSYQLFKLDAIDPQALHLRHAEVRDGYNLVRLNAAPIDTTTPAATALRRPLGAFNGKRMHLVQFAGPVQPDWLAALKKTGVKVVDYVPSNTYLVFGDTGALGQLQAWAATAPFVQWEAPYVRDHKIHPRARTVDAAGKPRAIGTDWFTIQLHEDADSNPATLALIDRLKLEPLPKPDRVLGFVNVIVRLKPADVEPIADQPDVVSIQPRFQPHKFCERQDQIIAGTLTGNVPTGPGYLSWLAGKGFTQAQFDASGFVVDVSDSGIDNGTTTPNHFGLYVTGTRPGTSRVVYSRLEGTANHGSTLQGCDGHGNLNTHIIAGYSNLSGFPHADSSGFRYGLGVCPFVRVGASVIFDPDTFTNPSYEDLQARAYRDGARISNNSWGTDTAGVYDSDAQRYDALVRDAQPSGSAVPSAGNQEMVIVVPAGNAGSGGQTVGSPGTGKNVIVVGAGESVQAFGGIDGSDVSDAGADSANDLIDFSGRGPCADGRRKPDLCAPGTHISGGAPQADSPGATGAGLPCFNARTQATLGVSGGVNGVPYFPSGQQFYTASSGTSHSTPAVAGACALLRQYFINQGWNAPSPAMTKAFLMNATRYMTGTGANDTLWSNNQGMGGLNLGMTFDGVARVLRDELEADRFTASGQTRIFTGNVVDSAKPFRVTLVWTDAPGSTFGNAYNNDLDLTVTIAGNTYKGNVFSGATSVTGGSADAVDNVESVFLPAGVSGPFNVTVTAANINSDGVPNNADPLDQDFALVIYNGLDVPPPLVQIAFPTNGLITAGRRVDVTGSVTDQTAVASVVVTNTRGGAVNAVVAVVNWTATGVPLFLGTNTLVATVTDTSANRASATVTIVRASTNYVDTTLRTVKVSGKFGATTNTDSFQLSGVYNDAELGNNFTGDSMGVMMGSFEQFLPSNSFVRLKFRARLSPSNNVTLLSFRPARRTFQLAAAGVTLTNGNPFLIGLAPGLTELGPDFVTLSRPASGAGKFRWRYGRQLPAVNQFFLGKSTLTTTRFNLTGTLNVLSKPNVLSNLVTFGISDYDETLPANGWTKRAGNRYTYTRPAGQTGGIRKMTLNFDRGLWSATGRGIDLSALAMNPTTDVRLEVGELEAVYPAKLVPVRRKYRY